MLTIKDVAKHAGVSIATVSYVLNRNRRVSRETAQKVREAIEKLGYTPNSAARALVTKTTRMIGVLVSNISNPFFAPIVRGIEDVASERGYIVMVGNSDESEAKARRYFSALSQHRIDGMIVSPVAGLEKECVDLCAAGTPVVFVNRRVDEAPADTVESDNELGAYKAVRHLCALGHTSIGLISGVEKVSTYADRRKGYERALADHLISVDRRLVRTNAWDDESACQLTRDLLEQTPSPTAVFAASGLLAAGAFRAIKEAGVRVPGDLSFVAYDDAEWLSLVSPTVTAVVQKTYEMGRSAANILLQRLAERAARNAAMDDEQPKEPAPLQWVKLEPELVARQSSGRVGDPKKQAKRSGAGERRE